MKRCHHLGHITVVFPNLISLLYVQNVLTVVFPDLYMKRCRFFRHITVFFSNRKNFLIALGDPARPPAGPGRDVAASDWPRGQNARPRTLCDNFLQRLLRPPPSRALARSPANQAGRRSLLYPPPRSMSRDCFAISRLKKTTHKFLTSPSFPGRLQSISTLTALDSSYL